MENLKKILGLFLPPLNEDQTVCFEQLIPCPVDEVFPFFSDVNNLEKITPPWLNFKIVNNSSQKISMGSIFNFKLKVHGIPIQWKTEIVEWEENRKFVDVQRIGPYLKWHHSHFFESLNGETRMIDQIAYQIPGGIIGKKLFLKWVKKDLESIFLFRRQKITEYFSNK